MKATVSSVRCQGVAFNLLRSALWAGALLAASVSVEAQTYCPPGSTYNSSNSGTPCKTGTCWSGIPFQGSTPAFLGFNYHFYACSANPPSGPPAGRNYQYSYDNQGNVTSVNGPLTGASDSTSHLYDALNRMTRVTQPGGGQVNYGYNVLDQLTSVSDPRSLATTYSVNALDNLTQQVSPDTGTTINTHDAAGNIVTQTDAHGRSATSSHDAMNRVTQIVHAKSGLPNVSVGFGYDAGTYGRGRLTSVTDPLGSVAFEYDGLGRVTRKTQTVGGSPVNFVVQYRYDSGGRLDKITYPSGRDVVMGFDSVGRVASVTEGGNPVVSGATYFPFGPVSGFTLNGQSISRPFDLDGRPTGYTMPGETRVLGYDNASRITSNQRPDASDPRTYGYDDLDRLTAHTAPSTSQSFGYDATGNRVSNTLGGTTYTNNISGTSNRLSSVTASGFSRSFTYDATGNTTTVTGNQAYTAIYDARGRLIQMQVGASTTAYIVNGLGQRVQKNGPFVPSGVNYFVFDEAGRLIGEYDTNGALIQETIYLNDVPVATIKPSGNFYIYADHLNTPRAITNASNQVVWRWELDPFGILPATENPSGLGTFEYNVRFPGQYFDKETNLHYNYFRDYGPAEGRYIQADPLGITTTSRPTPTTGLNHLYAYVLNDPLGAVDPLGLLRWKGSYHARGFVGAVGSVLMEFDLTSECVNGQQARVSVVAVGPAGGIGMRISETYSDVEFEDYLVDIRPTVFNGTFTASSAGVVIGRRGGSIGKIRLGGAYQVGGGNTRGIDVGANLATGSSTVTNVDIRDCKCK